MIDKEKVLDMIDQKIMSCQKDITQSLREVTAAIHNADSQTAQKKSVDVACHHAKVDALNELRKQVSLWCKPK